MPLVGDNQTWASQFDALGAFIRRQRTLANLSLRELADLASVSNAYLSQVERGLHEPSVRVLTSVARALNLSAETLLSQAGLLTGDAVVPPTGSPAQTTEAAILADPGLSDDQKDALVSVYRSFLAEGSARPSAPAGKRATRRPKPNPSG